MPVKVIVACGSGVATSQTIASKVNRMLKNDKIDAEVEAVDLKSVDRNLKDAAAYISIVNDHKTYDLPVINGIKFLTGMGQFSPFGFILPHDGCQNKFCGVMLFELAEYRHIFWHAVVRELFDILETDNAPI